VRHGGSSKKILNNLRTQHVYSIPIRAHDFNVNSASGCAKGNHSRMLVSGSINSEASQVGLHNERTRSFKCSVCGFDPAAQGPLIRVPQTSRVIPLSTDFMLFSGLQAQISGRALEEVECARQLLWVWFVVP